MAGNVITSINKLKGRENYEEWAFAVENYLILEGMEKCIKQDGEAMDAKARAKIILTIEPGLFVHIKNESTALSLWTKLQKMFDDTGFTRRIGLLRNLISIRRENCESMAHYVTAIVETSQRLNNTGFKISEEWVGSLLLAGLPEKFSPMIMAIEHSGLEITTDAIKSKLIDMEDSSEVSSQSAFVSRNWQPQNDRTKSNHSTNRNAANVSSPETSNSKSKQNVKCYKCKKMGHYKNQCNKMSSNAFSAVFLSRKFNDTDWYIDSGASMHMTTRKDWLKNLKNQSVVNEIVIADKSVIPVDCCGETQITTIVNSEEHDIPVSEVLYVPNLATNLLSVSQLIKKGNKVSFNNNRCMINNQRNELIATADCVDGVYKLNVKQLDCLFTPVSGRVWHRRFAHLNSTDLDKMRDGAVTGMSYTDKSQVNQTNCVVCCEGKQSRLPFSHIGNRSEELLQTVHADICGPMETNSIGGSRYFLLFVDDKSRMVFVYFLKTKDQALDKFMAFKNMSEKQTGKQIKILRTDNGLEFCNKKFSKYLEEEGILHQRTNPYTPQQNGMCERLNRTVVEKAKCLLFDAGLTKRYWAEAVNTAVYLRNRSVASGLNNQTPYEVWTGEKPDVSHVRIFGSKVMVHIPKEKRLKWDKKATKCILVGYPDNVKGYRVYNLDNHTITTTRDVVVIEEGTCTSEAPVDIADSTLECLIKTETPDGVPEDLERQEVPERQQVPEKPEVLDQREKRVRKQPDRYGWVSVSAGNEVDSVSAGRQVDSVSAGIEVDFSSDITLQDALNGPESAQWTQAMNDELKSFEDNEAWEVVDLPVNSTVVPCKWVFKRKMDIDNNITYRARLVAKGYVQKPGVDFDETFSPVLRHSSLRLLFALAAQMKLDVTHLDVKTAFLNGLLKETVYMKMPVGFQCDNKVLKLKKAIYGLKQSSRAWNQRVDSYLEKMGFKRSQVEPCLYSKINGSDKIYIALYVDDFFVFSNNVIETDKIKRELSSEFKIKDLGSVTQCLGMRVQVDKQKGIVTLDQEQYIEKLCKKFNVQNCKATYTPIEPKLNLNKSEHCNTQLPYQELIGSMMYLAVLTRPDIVFAVNYLSQFNNCYSDEHWAYAKRILKYLKTTKHFCLTYTASGNNKLEAYVDADWASNILDRRSYTGFFFTLSGGCVSWETRKQVTVALSSTEAEYMGISECCKEAIYLRNLQYEITSELYCITIFNDNQSAQKLANNNCLHKRSKHIDIRFHFFREHLINNVIRLDYIPTSEMPADLFTKGLNAVKHYKFLDMLGLNK